MKESEKDPLHLIFDRGELLGRVDDDFELLRDVIGIFKQEFPRHLLALREAVRAGNGKGIAFAAHTLKGMLSNLAASQAAAAAAQLEQMGRQGESLGIEEAFAVLESDASKLLPLLESCMTEVSHENPNCR